MRGVVRTILTVVMNVLLIVAGLLVMRIVIAFFARLGADPSAIRFMDLSAPWVPVFDLGSINSPYGGVFDFDAGATLLGALLLEWVAAVVRRFAR